MATEKARTPRARTVAQAIRRLLRARGANKTICPSEVARLVGGDAWRSEMEAVREVAARMAAAGEIVLLQKGLRVDARTAKGPVRLASGSIAKTKYVDVYRGVDFRAHPDRYRVGRAEEGVLIAEPYKSELLPLWGFRTEDVARASAAALWKTFVRYRRERDFVGMDMARKFLQMGFTRARRYANRRSGTKYAARDVARPRSARVVLPLEPDPDKAAAAAVFFESWQRAERDRTYARWKRAQLEAERQRGVGGR